MQQAPVGVPSWNLPCIDDRSSHGLQVQPEGGWALDKHVVSPGVGADVGADVGAEVGGVGAASYAVYAEFASRLVQS